MQINFENEISLRFLKLKYINARQNITYDCSNGVEAFEKLQLLTNNGNMIKYGDKQLRVVSEVRMYMCVCVSVRVCVCVTEPTIYSIYIHRRKQWTLGLPRDSYILVCPGKMGPMFNVFMDPMLPENPLPPSLGIRI